MISQEIYLGDGLYALDEGYMITLRAPRGGGDHWIGLEDEVLMRFIEFIERSRNVKITIDRLEDKS